MIFDTVHEAKEWFLDFKDFDATLVPSFWTKYPWQQWQFGDYFLIQHIKGGKLISRPILGIYLNATVWDQALVIEFVQNKRAWMFSHEAKYPNPKYSCLVGHHDTNIDTICLWHDNINVLGHWRIKPSLSELKTAIKKTI